MGHLVYRERFVGIDVSQSYFELAKYPNPVVCRFDNTPGGHELAVRELVTYAPKLIAVGTCGGEGAQLISVLEANQLCVAVINPCKARKFAEAIGILSCQDRVDAPGLAPYAHAVRRENLHNQTCIIFEEFLLKQIYLAWPA